MDFARIAFLNHLLPSTWRQLAKMSQGQPCSSPGILSRLPGWESIRPGRSRTHKCPRRGSVASQEPALWCPRGRAQRRRDIREPIDQATALQPDSEPWREDSARSGRAHVHNMRDPRRRTVPSDCAKKAARARCNRTGTASPTRIPAITDFHQRHYHGPGGLNGRVRNGNGCDPASMVAGNPPGRRSSTAGRWISDCWSHSRSQTH